MNTKAKMKKKIAGAALTAAGAAAIWGVGWVSLVGINGIMTLLHI